MSNRAFGRPTSAFDTVDFVGVPGSPQFPAGPFPGTVQNPIGPNLFLPYGTVSGQVLIWNGATWISSLASFNSGSVYVSGFASGVIQATSTLLVSPKTVLLSGAGSGVQINTIPLGVSWEIMNKTGGIVNVYPQNGSNAQFDSYGINTAVTISNNAKLTVTYITPTQGYVA